ncbi:MAG TPA: ribosome maturation factor RimP [Actinomycetes bacterium]|nr:ribosome maturation factor RimP [Actinomycetes bacterium]
MATKASDRDALVGLLGPVVSDSGLDLEDVVVTPAGKRRLVRVVVDQDGGVGLDTVAQVSTAVSAALDESDAMGASPYVLEVTSPGVDRPLSLPRHWRRAVDRLVKATLADGSTVTGRVLESDDDGVVLDLDGTPTRYAYADVTSARAQVEFNRRTAPGAAKDRSEES